MIVHKCDRCGREMGAWLNVKVYPGALNPVYNVGNLLKVSCELELCEDCYKKIIERPRRREADDGKQYNEV